MRIINSIVLAKNRGIKFQLSKCIQIINKILLWFLFDKFNKKCDIICSR